MPQEYKIVYEGGEAEIVEKKSRFIARVKKTETVEEAEAFINECKKKYWDARHNCSAFVIGSTNQNLRSNEDGEPSGTAGKPILEVLLGEELCNVTVVVTRYFGGTLLGTGGLVRAYQKATKEALANSVLMTKAEGKKIQLVTDYNDVGKLQYLFGQKGISILESEYAQNVKLTILVPVDQKEMMVKEITESTGGRASLEEGDTVFYGMADGKLVLFES